jgi:hypothetical protein
MIRSYLLSARRPPAGELCSEHNSLGQPRVAEKTAPDACVLVLSQRRAFKLRPAQPIPGEELACTPLERTALRASAGEIGRSARFFRMNLYPDVVPD